MKWVFRLFLVVCLISGVANAAPMPLETRIIRHINAGFKTYGAKPTVEMQTLNDEACNMRVFVETDSASMPRGYGVNACKWLTQWLNNQEYNVETMKITVTVMRRVTGVVRESVHVLGIATYDWALDDITWSRD